MTTTLNERISAIFNGKYTVQNRETGEHRTFSIKTQKEDARFAPGKRIIALLTGSNNETDYQSFGFVDDEGVTVWNKKRGTDGKRSSWEAYADLVWSLALDAGFSPYAPKYSLLIEGKCIVCNRTLTEPVSIETGIGPKCAGRA